MKDDFHNLLLQVPESMRPHVRYFATDSASKLATQCWYFDKPIKCEGYWLATGPYGQLGVNLESACDWENSLIARPNKLSQAMASTRKLFSWTRRGYTNQWEFLLKPTGKQSTKYHHKRKSEMNATNAQAIKLSFDSIQRVAQKIFGIQVVRNGSRFQLLLDDTLLGEGNGTRFTLKSIRELFQQYLNHPEVVDLLSPELQANLGQDVEKNKEARDRASRIGVMLVREKGNFYMFKDCEQLGYDFDEPWSAEAVIGYCIKYAKGMKTGAF